MKLRYGVKNDAVSIHKEAYLTTSTKSVKIL